MARAGALSQVRAHLVQQLKHASGVRLDEPFLTSLGDRTNVTAAELSHVIATIDGTPVEYGAVHPDVAQLFGMVRGHGIGPSARIDLAWKEVEARLLAREATSKGFDRAPAVRGVLAGIERNLLAAAVAARVGKTPDLRVTRR